MEKVCPIDLTLNKLGWGVDLALSHFARIMGLLVLSGLCLLCCLAGVRARLGQVLKNSIVENIREL